MGGRLTSDPNRSSLGLLPSGPDPVGEWLVHRQPPAPYIGGTERECKRHWGFPASCSGVMKSSATRPTWSLHPQLARDTAAVGDLALARVLAMNDANYPWVI